jgi:hypothetical protein
MVSVSSFAAAAAIGLVKTANDIRHKFYQAFVIGYEGRETVCTDILKKTNLEFAENEANFISGRTKTEDYLNKMHEIAQTRQHAVNARIKERFGIETESLWGGWIKGSYQRLQRLGSTNRMDAAMSFAGTATIALGAIAVLNHSSRVLDAINKKIASQEEDRTR